MSRGYRHIEEYEEEIHRLTFNIKKPIDSGVVATSFTVCNKPI